MKLKLILAAGALLNFNCCFPCLFCDLDDSLLLALLRSPTAYELPPATTGVTSCQKNVNSPAALQFSATGTILAGDSCYYKFISDRQEEKPAYTLFISAGDADLYAGMTDDPTGGAPGSKYCGPGQPGGGWIRCSRNTGPQTEYLDFSTVSGSALAPGDYRIVSIYGRASSPGTAFALTVEH